MIAYITLNNLLIINVTKICHEYDIFSFCFISEIISKTKDFSRLTEAGEDSKLVHRRI